MAEDKRRTDDEWTGSMKRPWMNPPRRHSMGAGRGTWKFGMLVIVLAIVVVLVVLGLVRADVLPRAFAYAVLPVAIIAAATSRVITIWKASEGETSARDPQE
ncbi:hypothetical protein ASD11_07480 [Aeromicrobium sp. Root495]|uniref:hypothetical protein n=1 Tax=Aeromicrobium sp. Root495 TaxID=1736550 RepID=UPI0006F5ACE8|nr:hypothetical protein [Aeromicrobium sp. Root495]KQY59400.1 hypothetical protein ASD11_07480 [Aeromicrobium sp. Root495]